jgi:hypothetical protein
LTHYDHFQINIGFFIYLLLSFSIFFFFFGIYHQIKGPIGYNDIKKKKKKKSLMSWPVYQETYVVGSVIKDVELILKLLMLYLMYIYHICAML